MNLRRLLLLLLIFGHAPEVSGQETPGQIPVASLTAALDPETKCLALSVYWEGKSETRKGQLAVAHTVLNRVGHPSFPDTICGVVSQQSDTGRRSCQFSWWCDGKRNLNEIKELCELEAGRPMSGFDLVKYYRFLEKNKLVVFVK